jgi:hypothetical protein
MRRSRVPLGQFATLVALLLLSRPVAGCTVPVYYYALGRWPASDHRLELGSAADAMPPSHANATPEAGDGTRLRAYFPGTNRAWWDEPMIGLDVAHREALLLESPKRRELVQRLAKGETGVWVVLESGDKERDQKAVDQLDERLRKVEASAKLPAADAQAQNPGESMNMGSEMPKLGVPPRVAFSVLRVARDDAAEAGFVAQLTALRDKLDASQPLAVLVFGRGRALGALTGSELEAGTIDDACLFLVGSCSCQVKDMNPGIDLLIDADWDTLLGAATPADAHDGEPHDR